jgi:dipeptidyl aminopeptidase/acylaminoacyl peptidase
MGTDVAKLAAVSPARHADMVDCPVLLMHGKNDTTVDFVQSRMMNQALTEAGKKVEFVSFEGEDHYFSLADTRIRVLKEMERFLKEHIGN